MKVFQKGIILIALSVFLVSCSIRRMAINTVADSLSNGGSSVFASDDVPELVRDAIPFGLKMNEALLEEVPNNKNLLLATTSGFTQYAYAFVQFEADMLRDTDFTRSRELRKQAHKLYLRSREYAIRGLEVDHPGFRKQLREHPQTYLRKMTADDVPFLYWAGVSWAAAISSCKEDLDLLSELYLVDEIMHCTLALDEDFNNGAIHEFFISFDGSRSEAMGGSIDRAQAHFKRVVQLSQGRRSSPYVTLAETVSVKTQNVEEFKALLNTALSIDVNASPSYRLENILAQRRATWLLANIDDLFLIAEEEPSE